MKRVFDIEYLNKDDHCHAEISVLDGPSNWVITDLMARWNLFCIENHLPFATICEVNEVFAS